MADAGLSLYPHSAAAAASAGGGNHVLIAN